MVQEWRPAAGWEGLYEVSNLGQVRSVRHVITVSRSNTRSFSYEIPEKLKKLSHNNTGYLTVALSRLGKTENVQVHVLVAQTFIPNPFQFNRVNHIDSNKHNNKVDNLEWCTVKGNNLHAVWNGKQSQAIPVRCVEDNKIFPSLAECDRFYNLSYGTTAGLSITGESDVHTGYHFERVHIDYLQCGIQKINSLRMSDCNS